MASFDFGQPIDNSLVVVYLISDFNGKVAIPFYPQTWAKFSLNPKVSNKLVAILPENKVVLLDSKALSKIDWQKVKASKAHTFDMSASGQTVKGLDDLKKLLH